METHKKQAKGRKRGKKKFKKNPDFEYDGRLEVRLIKNY